MVVEILHWCKLFSVAIKTNTYSTSMYHRSHIISYTRSTGYVNHDRDAWYPVLPLASCQSQSGPESISESHLSVTFITARILSLCYSILASLVYQSCDCQRPCQWLCQSCTCQRYTSQGHIIRASIARHNVRVHFHSLNPQKLCQSHICQSHINLIIVTRD